jgi:hypothetical protein
MLLLLACAALERAEREKADAARRYTALAAAHADALRAAHARAAAEAARALREAEGFHPDA